MVKSKNSCFCPQPSIRTSNIFALTDVVNRFASINESIFKILVDALYAATSPILSNKIKKNSMTNVLTYK